MGCKRPYPVWLQKRRNRRLTNADIALAMELRTDGCSWSNIAKGLGVDPRSIREAIRQSEIHGMKKEVPHKPEFTQSVNAYAATKLSQKS